MQFSLFDRMKAWAELLAKREDLEFRSPLVIKPPENAVPPFYADDARAFGEQAGDFSFVYHSRTGNAAGFLCLSLTGVNEPAYLELDGEEVDESGMIIFDGDIEGTGNAAWLVTRPGKPTTIIYSLEDVVTFPSLTHYLTEGAKRAFDYGVWQRDAIDQRTTDEATLSALSLPRSTPLAEVRASLIARGASPAMADDLIEWLGTDVVLLLPKDQPSKA